MRLLIVEDDNKVAGMLRQGLQESGYTTTMARTAPQAIELHAENPDYPTIIVEPGEPFAIEGLAVGLIRNTMLM